MGTCKKMDGWMLSPSATFSCLTVNKIHNWIVTGLWVHICAMNLSCSLTFDLLTVHTKALENKVPL